MSLDKPAPLSRQKNTPQAQKQTRPAFESFSLKSKPAFPRVVVKPPAKPLQDADDVHLSVVSSKDLKPSPQTQKQQAPPSSRNKSETSLVPPSSTSKRVIKAPARDESYVYDDEDEEDEGSHEKAPRSAQVAQVEESKPQSRRRQQRVIDDSSDEEYDPNSEKNVKKARRTMIDADDPLEEEDYPSNRIILVEDEEFTGDPKDVINHTLNKCDKIALALRSELKDGSEISASFSAPKVVTEAQVQAACQMAGSKNQMLTPYQLVGVGGGSAGKRSAGPASDSDAPSVNRPRIAAEKIDVERLEERMSPSREKMGKPESDMKELQQSVSSMMLSINTETTPLSLAHSLARFALESASTILRRVVAKSMLESGEQGHKERFRKPFYRGYIEHVDYCRATVLDSRSSGKVSCRLLACRWICSS